MKVWKHIVFIAGISGAFGILLPLIEVQHGKIAVTFSARELSFGARIDKARKVIDKQIPKIVEKRLSADVRDDVDDARLVAQVSRGAALIYIPAFLMVVVGLIGLVKSRFGRVLGASALLLGIASIGAWFGLRYGIAYGLEEAELPNVNVVLRFGGHIVLLAGIAAVIAGVGALARPERPTVPKPRA